MSELGETLGNKDWYFSNTNRIIKSLRFLNLLEPDRAVLSMTKFLLWGTTLQSIFVLQTSTDVTTVLGTLGINLAAMVKHETRRSAANKEGDK